MIARIKAYLITLINQADYRKGHRLAKALRWIMQYFVPKPVDGTPVPDHYLHDERLVKHVKYLKKLLKSKNKDREIDIAFGDSLIDLIRDYLIAIPDENNFAIAGSVHKHMLNMIKDLESYLTQLNVRYILIGTLGGNSLLAGRSLQETTDESLNVLKYLRNRFNKSKIIVYGLPPVYNIHATLNHYLFDQALYEWVLNDFNAVFLPLQKKFDPKNNPMLPQPGVMTSSDGVHLTPYGAVLFNELVEDAMIANPGSIID